MKARLPGNRDGVTPDMRRVIRQGLRNVARLTLIEKFSYGGSGVVIPRIIERSKQILAKYDELYPNPRDEIEALQRRLKADGLEFDIHTGSGEKNDRAREHDIAVSAFFLSLRREKRRFGAMRLKRFLSGLNETTQYYNNTFAGTDGAAFDVMRERLEQYGCATD